MFLVTEPFDLKAWRLRLRLTQAQAADALGYSLAAYRAMEYRNMDRPGLPCSRPIVKLAKLLEERAPNICEACNGQGQTIMPMDCYGVIRAINCPKCSATGKSR